MDNSCNSIFTALTMVGFLKILYLMEVQKDKVFEKKERLECIVCIIVQWLSGMDSVHTGIQIIDTMENICDFWSEVLTVHTSGHSIV